MTATIMNVKNASAKAIAGWIILALNVSVLIPAAHAGTPQSVQPGLWESRRGAAQNLHQPADLTATPVLMQSPDGVTAGFLPAPLRKLPYKYGDILQVKLSNHPRAPFVLLIQDARKVERAQRNIAGALGHIQSHLRSQRLFVGLEGFEGAYDLNLYRAQRRNAAQREVWNELISKSLITGAEYFGLTAENEPLLWGAEDPALYKKSFDAFQYGPEAEKDARGWAAAMRADLDQVKSLIFADDLLKLDRLAAQYEAEEIGLGEYVKFFRNAPEVNSGKYPEIEKYFALLELEKSMDARKVQKERDAFMKILAAGLKPAELGQLVEMSFAHRVGRVGAALYYGYLRSAAVKVGADMNSYPALSTYIQYALMGERIDAARLASGLKSLKNACFSRLAKTPEQREALDLTAQLTGLEKLIGQELSSEEWSDYLRDSEKVRSLPVSVLLLKERVNRKFGGLIASKSASSGAPVKKPAVSNLSGYVELLAAFEGFYAAAQPRRAALVDNFARQVRSRSGDEVSVLVAGGFHSAALAQDLEARGISYAIFRPRH